MCVYNLSDFPLQLFAVETFFYGKHQHRQFGFRTFVHRLISVSVFCSSVMIGGNQGTKVSEKQDYWGATDDKVLVLCFRCVQTRPRSICVNVTFCSLSCLSGPRSQSSNAHKRQHVPQNAAEQQISEKRARIPQYPLSSAPLFLE